jgi:two-component system, NtrC family, response regulator AtoC
MPTSNRNSQSQSPHRVDRNSRAEQSGPALASREVFDQLAVISTDLLGNITGWNQAALELYGLAHDELMGKRLASLFSSEAKQQEKLQKAILSEAIGKGSYHGQIAGDIRSFRCGEDASIEISATLLRGANSAPVGLVILSAARRLESPRPESHPPAAAMTLQTQEAAAVAPAIICREIDGTQFILASPIMQKFMGLVDRVAGHTETVLVTGETGTGKELIARTIHESSHRRGRAWVDINCAALPENLVESELFGYEKGAFSGADASKAGLFELADKGTLFLDEIGDLQLQTQVKLLRVLDGQPFYRVGGHRKIKVDVRIVAATNQDLEAAVKESRFRKDLYHRLSQFQLRVPPLRERPEDIVALAEHFLRLKAPEKVFQPEVASVLLSHPWPGNIRELRNVIAKVCMDTSGPEIHASKITAELRGETAIVRHATAMPVGNLDSMEEQMIIRALERTGGHRALAAEQLGISRRTLSRKLKEYNISSPMGDTSSLGVISFEQQKFFRARVQLSVTIRNTQGEETHVQGVNLSTGGMGLDGLPDPMRFSGLVDVSFLLPESETIFQAKGRLVWAGDGGRVGLRFAVIEPALFEDLQHWTNKKMREEGWEFPN